jgi:hypothetical protein
MVKMDAHERAVTIAMLDIIHRQEKKQQHEMKSQTKRVH